MKYALIACTSKKLSGGPHQAKELYWPSDLFRKAITYAEGRGMRILILSAKHGLLKPDDSVHSYDLALRDMPVAERRDWASEVSHRLLELVPKGSDIELHAGNLYIKFLNLDGYKVANPLEGLTIGKRLKWYGDQRVPRG